MGVNYFTNEQINELEKNPYVQKVTNKAITYTEEFRKEFYQRYCSKQSQSSIMHDLGFDVKVLGHCRIHSITKRIKKMAADRADFSDTRKNNTGRLRRREMTLEEEIVYLKHKLKYQQQQIEALKKINIVNKKQIWKQQKKNLE